jgi:hypothetical protein
VVDIKTLDIARLLGEPPAFPQYRLVTGKLEYEECHDQALELKLAQREREWNDFAPVATRSDIWERCWQGCLDKYKAGGSIADLLPDFLRDPKPPFRYLGKYILPGNSTDLHTVQKCILSHLLVKWMRGTVLLEFGCGSGYNLPLAKQWLEPGAMICGLDWSPAAIQCVKALGFPGSVFDMHSPTEPSTSTLPWSDTTVLTAGAMEQLGGNFSPFLEFLLAKRPRMCIHVEPLFELYDLSDPMDEEAARYHAARGYLAGFLPALQQLQREGRVQICELHRTHFGARFNDGFSWVVWRVI